MHLNKDTSETSSCQDYSDGGNHMNSNGLLNYFQVV